MTYRKYTPEQREACRQYQKEYRLKNLDKIKEYQKKYQKENRKEKIDATIGLSRVEIVARNKRNRYHKNRRKRLAAIENIELRAKLRIDKLNGASEG